MTRAIEDLESVNVLLEHMRNFEGDIRRVYSDHRGIPTIGIGYAMVIGVESVVDGVRVTTWQIREAVQKSVSLNKKPNALRLLAT